MRLIFVFIPFILFAFNIEGFKENAPISKKYCYSYKKALSSYIIIDNYRLNKNYILSKISKIEFASHERIYVFYFNNSDNTLKKVFEFCVPGFTSSEASYISRSMPVWKRAMSDLVGEAEDDKKSFFYTKLKFSIKKIPFSKTKKNFADALKEIDFEKQSRIFIFTFNNLKGKANFNYSYGSVYMQKVPSVSEKNELKNFFMKSKGYLSGVNYSFIEKVPSNYKFYDISVNLLINKSYKARFLLIVDNKGKLFNSWFEVYGILLAPIKGKARFLGNKLISLKAEVIDDYKYYGNMAKKGDKIVIKRIKGKLIGKYYNYGYVLKNNPDKYFEYEIKE